MSIEQIEHLTHAYAAARAELADAVSALQGEIDRLTRAAMPRIRLGVRAATSAQTALQEAVDAQRELFEKPRTRVFHGVRVGIMTGKAKVEIPDEAETIRRIRQLLPKAQAELLIAVNERVDKRAVADLTAADLKRLRIRVEPGQDDVVIKPTDGAVDKLVAALLKDAERI